MFDPEEDVFGNPIVADAPTCAQVFADRMRAAAAAEAAAAAAAATATAGWSTAGSSTAGPGAGPFTPSMPDTSLLSPPVQALLVAVPAVVAQLPAELPGPQALADTAALLTAVEQLHAAVLGRVADVDARKLHTLAGAASTGSWIAQQQTSLDRGQVALARRLAGLPLLQDTVRAGQLSVAVAEQVGKALAKLRRHVDRPDGLIDGQDGQEVLLGVIGHGIPDLICQALAGLADDDPRLAAVLAELASIVDSATCQLARLEAAFVLLAQHLEPHALPDALKMLIDACLPNELEKRAADGHDNRGFNLRLNADGSGWHITQGELDLETGELLHTVLQAELTADPDNPADTAAFEQLRADGWQTGDELPSSTPAGGTPAGRTPTGSGSTDAPTACDPAGHGAAGDPAGDPAGCAVPRSLRQKRHDALRNGLRRLLDSGALGLRDKVAPHIAVTLGADTLHQIPGALPAVAASGARLPTSLVRNWWCDSAITRFVLSLRHRVIETSHSQRTLKAHERRAKNIETGGRCQAAGCRCGPGSRLTPHHADPWAKCRSTSLADTVNVCDQTHHDLHSGGHTIRLRDGRWLSEHGWTSGPSG